MYTLLYDLSIPAISSLQDRLSGQANSMQLLSVVFDPKYAFLIYSPLAFLLDRKVGLKLIMTTVIAEWLNQILKWLLHGERPYWYVHSSGHFDTQQVSIKQYPITCELGPGHPSGHAMVTASVWYIILNSLLEAYNRHQSSQVTTTGAQQDQMRLPKRNNKLAHLLTWSLYATILMLVSVSRVFLGCHFPHQCAAGAALGLILAKWVSSLDMNGHHFAGASAFLFATAFGTFGLLQMLGFDPSWTLKLATKHCVKRDYIHLDTAPFFSIMRYCGFALGSGLGLMIPLKAYSQPIGVPKELTGFSTSRNITWLSFKVIMAMLMARLVDNLGLFVSHANLIYFYSSAFMAYTGFSYAFINL